MPSSPITSWQIDGETMETVTDFLFSWAPKSLQMVTAAMKLKDACSLKPMTNLDSILKSRDNTLLTKVHMVKAMVFPVVMYGCESWTIKKAAAAAAKSLQSCLTLCNPIDGSPLGSSVPGILQARILEWVAISFSNACMLSRFSHVQLCAALWTAAHQAPLSMGFSRQEY